MALFNACLFCLTVVVFALLVCLAEELKDRCLVFADELRKIRHYNLLVYGVAILDQQELKGIKQCSRVIIIKTRLEERLVIEVEYQVVQAVLIEERKQDLNPLLTSFVKFHALLPRHKLDTRIGNDFDERLFEVLVVQGAFETINVALVVGNINSAVGLTVENVSMLEVDFLSLVETQGH